MYLYLLSVTHDYTNCSTKSSKTEYLWKNFTCWPLSMPIHWWWHQTGPATNQEKQAKVTLHRGPSTRESAFMVCKKQERHRPVHQLTTLATTSQLHPGISTTPGGFKWDENKFCTHWVLIGSPWFWSSLRALAGCLDLNGVCALGHSVICLYPMKMHTRPQTPTYIHT